MNEPSARLRSVFHPSDFTVASDTAFAHALRIALDAGSEFCVLHVSGGDTEWIDFPGVRHTLTAWGILAPGASRADVTGLGIDVRKVIARHRDPVEAVSLYLQDHPTDLVVVATHQEHGVARWLHRAISEPIARGTRAATLFVPAGREGFVSAGNGKARLERVLIAVDEIPDPRSTVDLVVELANRLGSARMRVTLCHVGDYGSMPAVDTPAVAGCEWRHATYQGNVVEEILAVAEESGADLIAMPTHGHDGLLDALRGSTTERVVRLAKCPVLAVPA